MTYEEYFEYLRSHMVGVVDWHKDLFELRFFFEDAQSQSNMPPEIKNIIYNSVIIINAEGRILKITNIPKLKFRSPELEKAVLALSAMERLKK